MLNKTKSVGFISPSGISKNKYVDRFDLYRKERELIKEDFKGIGGSSVLNWQDPIVAGKLQEFARQVINVTSENVNRGPNLLELVLPTETVQPGDTFVLREIHGVDIFYGTYGASVRMSRPQFTQYTQTTNLKEVGLKLELTQIRTGKYSPSELADYTTGLITAWRNYLLFTTTLSGATAYASGGAQYQSGAGIGVPTMLAALNRLNDDAEPKVIIARRSALAKLSNMGLSEASKEEFEKYGQVGTWAGIPVVKVNSFTDPDYGLVTPFLANDLWIFSEAPAGRVVIADALRTNDEIIAQNETMNMYFRWDDGIGIFYTPRIVRVALIS